MHDINDIKDLIERNRLREQDAANTILKFKDKRLDDKKLEIQNGS